MIKESLKFLKAISDKTVFKPTWIVEVSWGGWNAAFFYSKDIWNTFLLSSVVMSVSIVTLSQELLSRPVFFHPEESVIGKMFSNILMITIDPGAEI